MLCYVYVFCFVAEDSSYTCLLACVSARVCVFVCTCVCVFKGGRTLALCFSFKYKLLVDAFCFALLMF